MLYLLPSEGSKTPKTPCLILSKPHTVPQSQQIKGVPKEKGKVEAADGNGLGRETAVVEKGGCGKCEGEGEEEETEFELQEEKVRGEKVKEESVKGEKVMVKGCEAEDGEREKDAPLPKRAEGETASSSLPLQVEEQLWGAELPLPMCHSHPCRDLGREKWRRGDKEKWRRI